MRRVGFFLILWVVLLPFLYLKEVYPATFLLSVSPYEGGYSLRYGKVSPASGRINKEVNVSITSDIAKQYRLVQTLMQPLTDTQGNSIPANYLYVYGIRGTNKYGTLNIEQPLPLSLGRQVLYTSNQIGASDSFTLVYSLVVPPDAQTGSYRGRIGFSLEPVDSTQSPVTAILDILAEIEVESGIEISTSSGRKNITLKYDPQASQEGGFFDVRIEIKGGFGQQFRILQVVSEQPVSTEGDLLNWEVVKFYGSLAKKGMVINQPTELSVKPQVIYTSSPKGEADSFVITYQLGDLSKEKAGTYTSKIKYILEGTGTLGNRLLDTLGIQIENPRIFDLIVSPELGGTIQFRDLRPDQPPKTQEVIFQIRTNIGKPYQVTQNMASLLTTKEGFVIPNQYFTLRQESLETKGILKYPQKTELKEGQMVLFVSDSKGSPDKFKVIYELSVPRDIHYGDYSTRFTYLISEI